MLVSIQCDKFKTKKPIVFHSGLNTIVGDGNNSIGKSTFLMIIDYCFGGNDYCDKERNVLDAIGPHDIKFVFEFKGEKKYFIRNSHKKGMVKVCDSNFDITTTISIDSFRTLLSKYYGLDKSNLTLRSYLSPYFRIYNRETHNELKPLNATVRQADENGVICLLKIYGLYNQVEQINNEYLKCVAARDTLTNTFRTDLAPIAKNESEVQNLKIQIDRLNKELTQIKIDNASETGEVTLINEASAQDLRDEKRKLEKEKRNLMRQLNDINYDNEYYEANFQSKFVKLQEFFPEINIERLKDIESFHKTISGNLKNEATISNEKINDMLRIIDKQIDELLTKLKELGVGARPSVPEAVLERYNEVSQLMTNKQNAINNFYKLKIAKENLALIKEKRDKSVENIFSNLSNKINNELNQLNNNIRPGGEYGSPEINIQSFESYSFQISTDIGTGSRFKSVCMLDITLLRQTDLPAIAHDSIMFDHISADTCVDLFKEYIQLENKQLFVGVDKIEKFNDGNNPNLAWNSKVIELSKDEGTLFGIPINKRQIK